MRRTQEKFLEQCKKGCLALNLRILGPRTDSGLDQKLYEDDRSSRNVKISYVTVYDRTKKSSLKTRKNN